MSEPDLPIADFAFGQTYDVVLDEQHPRYLVKGADGRAVASLPISYGGEVFTRTDHWFFTTEQHKLGWALVALSMADKSEIGHVREGLVPETFKLSVVPDLEFRVTHNPVTRTYVISHRGLHLARLSDARNRTGHRGRIEAGEVTTLDSPTHPVPLALVILLTLEMIKADGQMSGIGGSGGAMIY